MGPCTPATLTGLTERWDNFTPQDFYHGFSYFLVFIFGGGVAWGIWKVRMNFGKLSALGKWLRRLDAGGFPPFISAVPPPLLIWGPLSVVPPKRCLLTRFPSPPPGWCHLKYIRDTMYKAQWTHNYRNISRTTPQGHTTHHMEHFPMLHESCWVDPSGSVCKMNLPRQPATGGKKITWSSQLQIGEDTYIPLSPPSPFFFNRSTLRLTQNYLRYKLILSKIRAL